MNAFALLLGILVGCGMVGTFHVIRNERALSAMAVVFAVSLLGLPAVFVSLLVFGSGPLLSGALGFCLTSIFGFCLSFISLQWFLASR